MNESRQLIKLDSPNKALTTKQIENVYNYSVEIVNNISDKGLEELISAYQGDMDKLVNEIVTQTNNIINHNQSSLESEKLEYLNHLEVEMDEQLKILSYNYFKATCLTNFRMQWRNIEWGNLVQLNPWSAYLCQRGSGKCFAKGTEVLMFDGSIKNIEDIKIGDELMGVDNSKRVVLTLHNGVDDLYKVKQYHSSDYIVNSRHDLYIDKHKNKTFLDKNGNKFNGTDWDIDSVNTIRIEAKEFFNKSKTYKSESFGKKKKFGWELEEKELFIEPYWLGLWLGDGNKHNTEVANIDFEVIEYIKGYAGRLGLRYSCWKGGNVSHNIVCNNGGNNMVNKLLDHLRYYNLVCNKHIPDIYMRSSKKQRLELLAGLIDSDGSVNKNDSGKKVSYSISQKNEYLVKQIQLLCWSLGFRTNYKRYSYDGSDSYIHIVNISGFVSEIPCKIERKIINYFIPKKLPYRSGLDIEYIGVGGYFGFTCDKDHLFLLKDGTIVSNSFEFCYAFPLWRLYSYNKPHPLITNTQDNQLRKETCIITNETRLANIHIGKIVEEIKINDTLGSKLNPRGKADLAKESIITETGSMLHRRTYGSMIRGLHVGSSITDDFLDKSCLYSKDQRDKFHEVFYAEIKNIIEPNGYNLVSGTPFHVKDLYGDLKEDNMFRVFTYPGIMPNMDLLAPDRFTWKYLMDLKKSLGSIVFSREILVTPVSDSSSLFPYEYLNTSKIGMENVRYVDNIDSFPIKLVRVTIGADFAISGNIGADFTVYTVWGVDSNEKYYLLYIWRQQGASHNTQISQLVSLNIKFKPNKIVCESNGFQKILSDMATERGLNNIVPFTTTSGVKKSLYEGLPSLSAIFERGEIKIPWNDDEYTRDTTNLILSEFNSITFNSDSAKLESSDQHDDCVMSSFFALTDLRENKVEFSYTEI